jgi:hypothetical protein
MLSLLQKVCCSLDEHALKYMVYGSIASNIYGIPRMTRDIDIVIELPDSKIEEFTGMFPGCYFNICY